MFTNNFRIKFNNYPLKEKLQRFEFFFGAVRFPITIFSKKKAKKLEIFILSDKKQRKNSFVFHLNFPFILVVVIAAADVVVVVVVENIIAYAEEIVAFVYRFLP